MLKFFFSAAVAAGKKNVGPFVYVDGRAIGGSEIGGKAGAFVERGRIKRKGKMG